MLQSRTLIPRLANKGHACALSPLSRFRDSEKVSEETTITYNRMEHPSFGTGVEGVVRRDASTGTVTVSGRVTGLGGLPQRIMWIAAAPVTRGIGFMGSGQPYPSRDIALEGTPNRGTVDSPDGSFIIRLAGIPAGYFSELGSTYVPPVVEFLSTTRDGKRLHTSLWINDTAAPYENSSPKRFASTSRL